MGPAGKLCHPRTSPWTTNLSPSPLPNPSFRSLQTLGVAAGAAGVKTRVPCEHLIKIPWELPLQAAQVEAALDAEPNRWRFASRRPCEHAARRPEAGAEKYSRGVRPFINPIIVGELSDGVQGSSVPDPAGYLGLKCCFASFPVPHLCPGSDAEASPGCWGPCWKDFARSQAEGQPQHRTTAEPKLCFASHLGFLLMLGEFFIV